MLDYARGDEIPMDDTLQRFPIALTSVRDYARSVLNGTAPKIAKGDNVSYIGRAKRRK